MVNHLHNVDDNLVAIVACGGGGGEADEGCSI
jgi:hypothetical protein